jgi:phenylpropionate dioxygenase-like ring-hydroxylating dioxygenase large terminal subunit
MIGHESLVPAADDFFHTYMGEDPVILTRDGGGRLHAHLNMCRHRGNRVVRCDDGNAKRFMCTYHGRTYRNDGALIRSIVKHFQKLASAFAALQGSAAKSMVSTLRL